MIPEKKEDFRFRVIREKCEMTAYRTVHYDLTKKLFTNRKYHQDQQFFLVSESQFFWKRECHTISFIFSSLILHKILF